jgi:hypothetical protein
MAPHRFAIPLPHIQPVFNIVHSISLIPNFKKQHKNIKAINTTTSLSLLFIVSIAIMNKHSKPKTTENVLSLKP